MLDSFWQSLTKRGVGECAANVRVKHSWWLFIQRRNALPENGDRLFVQ